MKRVITVGIGGKSFVIDHDGYDRLEFYLNKFREKIGHSPEREQVMKELEERIAELFLNELELKNSVVSLSLVNNVISQLGMPDGSPLEELEPEIDASYWDNYSRRGVRSLYRDMERKKLGGVAGGVAHYFDIDISLVRLLFVLVTIFSFSGAFWVYIVMWIVVPEAKTALDRCKMRGVPPTAENLHRYRWRG